MQHEDQSGQTPPEAIRLVIWDLDETFWRGTLSEGGIAEYVQAHHDMVITLARRGIMSSVCSKNSAEAVLPILRDKGLLDYIVFPSISWDAKGPRLAALVNTVQLRAPSVMFIDDNPNNLAEARAMVPGLQVADETFLPRLLDDPRFAGKDDQALTRLAQYKLLEARKQDETSAGGDNHAFLRGCDVRVHIEYDVLKFADRAIELINRTNQLNYTKVRLPEDQDEAREALAELCRGYNSQAGLIHVADKYGDYGMVGFYLMRNQRSDPAPDVSNSTLVHYAFSCRTLGMLIEKWVYDHLRRPALSVVGEVLTDLETAPTVDWVRQVASLDEAQSAAARIAGSIRFLGGCEANAIAHFLAANTPDIRITANFAAGPLFIRNNSLTLLLSAMDHAGPAFAAETARLGFDSALLGTGFLDDAGEDALFIVDAGFDAAGARFRVTHRDHGWEFCCMVSASPLNLVTASEAEVAEVARRKSPEEQAQLAERAAWLRQHYVSPGPQPWSARKQALREFVRRLPAGSRVIFLLDDTRLRDKDGTLRVVAHRVRYNQMILDLIATRPFTAAVAFADFIQGDDEIQQGGNHYERMVYARVAERVVEIAPGLPGKVGSRRPGALPLDQAGAKPQTFIDLGLQVDKGLGLGPSLVQGQSPWPS